MRPCAPVCARVRPCVPCVSRLPPVSFYRYSSVPAPPVSLNGPVAPSARSCDLCVRRSGVLGCRNENFACQKNQKLDDLLDGTSARSSRSSRTSTARASPTKFTDCSLHPPPNALQPRTPSTPRSQPAHKLGCSANRRARSLVSARLVGRELGWLAPRADVDIAELG